MCDVESDESDKALKSNIAQVTLQNQFFASGIKLASHSCNQSQKIARDSSQNSHCVNFNTRRPSQVRNLKAQLPSQDQSRQPARRVHEHKSMDAGIPGGGMRQIHLDVSR